MDTRTERDTVIRTERTEMYEPPMLDEIGGFTALTRSHVVGSVLERSGYFPG
jgi:hypothetical protein